MVTLAAHAINEPICIAAIHRAGSDFWPLAMARELDDAILHLRLNEPALGILVFRSEGDPATVLAADALLETHADDWLIREIRLYLKRVPFYRKAANPARQCDVLNPHPTLTGRIK